MRILITGAAGYIGSRLGNRLREIGHSIIGLDRVHDTFGTWDEFYCSDLLEPSSYRNLLPRVDQVCHLAAAKGDWGISRSEYFRDNLEATRVLLDAGREARVKSWIFYSTVSALGSSDIALPESAPYSPKNDYGASKAACEKEFERYVSDNSDVHVVVIRPSVVYGPGNPWNTNIFRLIDAIYRQRFVMIGRGDEVKTTSYIENLLDAHVFLHENMCEFRRGMNIFHYVDSPSESTAMQIERIYRLLGKSAPWLRVPKAVGTALAVFGDIAASIGRIDLPITSARVRKFCTPTNFSSSRIRQLGFQQKASNEEAMRTTIEWYLDEYLNAKTM